MLPSRRSRLTSLTTVAGILVLAACGPKHHLAEYSFAGRTMALVVIAPPSPALLEAGFSVRDLDDVDGVVGAVAQAGATVAKNAQAGRARARLDSATTRAGLADALAQHTVARASRYLGMEPVADARDADFVLEVHVRNYGLDVRGSAAMLFTNAETVLLERRTGREIWNVRVRGRDRLTPWVGASDRLPGTVITAATLHTVSVADFRQALDQLVQFSSNRIADELRESLRDARK